MRRAIIAAANIMASALCTGLLIAVAWYVVYEWRG